MATVIDSLVVELGMDTRKFEEGERTALVTVEEFKRRLATVGKNHIIIFTFILFDKQGHLLKTIMPPVLRLLGIMNIVTMTEQQKLNYEQ